MDEWTLGDKDKRGQRRVAGDVVHPTSTGSTCGVPDDSPDPKRRRRPFSVPDAIAALGLAAGIAYALGRISLALFYGEFGVSPEEVGWNLEKTVSGFLVVVLIVSVVVLFATVVSMTAVNALGHKMAIGSKPHNQGWTAHWQSGVALGVVLSMAVVVVGLVTYPQELARHVADGRIPNSVLLRTLPIQLSCVQLLRPEVSGTSAEQTLILLGRHDGVIVLLDPKRDRSMRVDSGGVELVGSDCPLAVKPEWLF